MELTMFTQCTSRESGGVRCEVMLATPDEPHTHWISPETVEYQLAGRWELPRPWSGLED